MLHEFLAVNTAEIIARTRAKVAARTSPVPTASQLKNGVPLFLAQLIDRLTHTTNDSVAIEKSAALHGGELLRMGFVVGQVIHSYGDVCQVITEMADETDAQITAEEFHTFNRCLDDAIAHSVTEFERQRDVSVAYDGTERVGILASELRTRLSAAMLAFTMLQEGTVGVGGSTGAVLGRSLRGMRDLVNTTLAGVRLESGLGKRRRVSVADLVGEVQVEASLGADVRGFGLTVTPVAEDIFVNVDQQIISAAIGNFLQNAFKFNRPEGRVTLRTLAIADRVFIEVEDECGGLLPGEAEELSRPIEQQSDAEAGRGLGLSISRKSIAAMGGVIAVRDLPGKGCVFSIELPRLPLG